MFDDDGPPPTRKSSPAASGAASRHGDAALIGDIGFIAAKWMWQFLAILLLVIAAGLIYIGLIRSPVFESETRLFVRVSQEQLPQTMRTRDGVTFMPSSRADVVSEIDLLLNGDLVERVINATRLDEIVTATPPPPETLLQAVRQEVESVVDMVRDQLDEVLILLGLRTRLTLREALIEQVQRSIQILNTRDSNVIALRIRWGAREVPHFLLTHYLEAYLDFRHDVFSADEPNYFEQQLEDARAAIQGISLRQRELRTEGDIHAIAEQRANLVSLLSEARAERQTAVNRLRRARSRLEAFQNQTPMEAGVPVLANIPDHQILSGLDQSAIQLSASIERMSARGLLQAAEGEALQREYALVRATTIETLQDYADSLEIEVEALSARIAEHEARLERLSAFEADWRATERDMSIVERSYRHFAERLDEARDLEELRAARMGNVVVLQPPSEGRLTTDVRNARLLAVIAVFGLLLALAWVSVREYFDRRIYRAQEVEDLAGMVPLAVVPRPRRRQLTADAHKALKLAATRLHYLLGRPTATDAATAAVEAKRDPQLSRDRHSMRPFSRTRSEHDEAEHGDFTPPSNLIRDAAGERAVVIAPLTESTASYAEEVLGLSRALARQTGGRVLLVNLCAWTPGDTSDWPGTQKSREKLFGEPLVRDSAGLYQVGISSDAGSHSFVAALDQAPANVFEGWDSVIIATPPLAGSDIAVHATLSVRRLILRLRAGKDEHPVLTSMLHSMETGGVKLVGTLLSDWRNFGFRKRHPDFS